MPDRTCSIDECDRPFYGRGWCQFHWLRWYRHGDTSYERPHRRMRCAERGPRLVQQALDGNWADPRASICGDPVDPNALRHGSLYPSIDHIIPISRGGEHSRANVQTAHLGCNVRKGASVA